MVGEGHVFEGEGVSEQLDRSCGRVSSGSPKKSQITFRQASIREIWLAACANLSTPPMNPSGMEMHTMNAGRPSCPVESSQTPRGSETSNVQGTTA